MAIGYQKVTYNGNDVILEYYDKNNVKSNDLYTAKLGSNGYISSDSDVKVYTDYQGVTKTTTRNTTFTYNAEGYLTKEAQIRIETSNDPLSRRYTEKDSTTHAYSNGNRVSSEWRTERPVLPTNRYGGGNSIRTANYEYYADKINNLPHSGNMHSGKILEFLLGKRSTNLLKAGSLWGEPGNYTYTFNSDGLVSKQIFKTQYKMGNSYFPKTENYLFDYNCK